MRRYRTLPLPFVQNELAFDTVTLAREFLTENNSGIFQDPNAPDADKVFDCKAAGAPLAKALEEKYRRVQIKGAV